MYSQELIKGTVATLILKLLSNNKRMYGYQISMALKEATDGKINLSLAAIYPILHKMKANGELTIEKESIGKRVRIYYSLTDKGDTIAKDKLKEFADYLSTMKAVIEMKKGLQSFSMH